MLYSLSPECETSAFLHGLRRGRMASWCRMTILLEQWIADTRIHSYEAADCRLSFDEPVCQVFLERRSVILNFCHVSSASYDWCLEGWSYASAGPWWATQMSVQAVYQMACPLSSIFLFIWINVRMGSAWQGGRGLGSVERWTKHIFLAECRAPSKEHKWRTSGVACYPCHRDSVERAATVKW